MAGLAIFLPVISVSFFYFSKAVKFQFQFIVLEACVEEGVDVTPRIAC